MRNLWREIFCLAQLERSKQGVTTDRIHSNLVEADLKPPVIRTLQRDIEKFRNQGFSLVKKGTKYSLGQDEETLGAFLSLLKKYSLTEEGAPLFFGGVDVRQGIDYFAGREGVIDLIYQLMRAIREKRIVVFEYTPQSDITRRRMLARARHEATNKRVIPVRLMPHRLVISGSSFLVLGEFYEKKGLFGKIFKDPVVRHYELRGIEKFEVAEVASRKLHIDPTEIYRNSLHVWAGGREYEVELEEFWYDGGKPRRRKRKVNGEDEVLSLAAGSLGRIKIVNPPAEMLQRAEALGLPKELVFRIE